MPDDKPVAGSLSSYLANSAGLALPELSDAEEAAVKILALYESNGGEGATYSLRFGDMSGQPLYSVSLWPERGRKVLGNTVKLRALQSFIMENMELLNDPRGCIGLWYNADENATYLDITAALPNQQEAQELAVQYDQIAIFDLKALTEIETGGMGNTPADMPTATERWPQIKPAQLVENE